MYDLPPPHSHGMVSGLSFEQIAAQQNACAGVAKDIAAREFHDRTAAAAARINPSPVAEGSRVLLQQCFGMFVDLREAVDHLAEQLEFVLRPAVVGGSDQQTPQRSPDAEMVESLYSLQRLIAEQTMRVHGISARLRV